MNNYINKNSKKINSPSIRQSPSRRQSSSRRQSPFSRQSPFRRQYPSRRQSPSSRKTKTYKKSSLKRKESLKKPRVFEGPDKVLNKLIGRLCETKKNRTTYLIRIKKNLKKMKKEKKEELNKQKRWFVESNSGDRKYFTNKSKATNYAKRKTKKYSSDGVTWKVYANLDIPIQWWPRTN